MKPNLLFLSHRMPWPPDKGEKIRSWNLIRHLSDRFAIHLGFPADDPADRRQLEPLEAICASVHAIPVQPTRQKLRALMRARPGRPLMPDVYHAPRLQRRIDEAWAERHFDVVYIYTVAMAPYALHLPGARRILDAVDIDSEKWRGYAETARLPMRAVWAREGRNLLAYERHAAARCDVTLFVSEPEARRFQALAPEVAGRVNWVENGVDLDHFSPAHQLPSPFPPGSRPLVFTGHMDYRPNVEAMLWFADNVLPRLWTSVPGASLWIVGANPAPAIGALAARPGIHVTGRVPDTRPFIAHAAAIVCPLLLARGIQNKVLEAMAMGRPVIASPAAFEGVRAAPGADLLVADGPDAFLEAIGQVLGGAHDGMGRRARRAMEAGYAWTRVLSRLDRWLPPPGSGLSKQGFPSVDTP